jgi:hypothetical protein
MRNAFFCGTFLQAAPTSGAVLLRQMWEATFLLTHGPDFWPWAGNLAAGLHGGNLTGM